MTRGSHDFVTRGPQNVPSRPEAALRRRESRSPLRVEKPARSRTWRPRLPASERPWPRLARVVLPRENMRSATRRKAGFSLIELMVAVAIIGTLASMAIPSFQRMQLRSRAAEGRTNLASLRTSQEGYFAEFGTYIGAAPTPAAIPSGSRVPWPGGLGFDTIGWLPDGAIQFQYAVTIPGGGGGVWSYTAEAASDLDEDGQINLWGYVKQDAVGVGVVGVLGCQDTGVWDAFTGTPTIVQIVGPCDAVSGQSVF